MECLTHSKRFTIYIKNTFSLTVTRVWQCDYFTHSTHLFCFDYIAKSEARVYVLTYRPTCIPQVKNHTIYIFWEIKTPIQTCHRQLFWAYVIYIYVWVYVCACVRVWWSDLSPYQTVRDAATIIFDISSFIEVYITGLASKISARRRRVRWSYHKYAPILTSKHDSRRLRMWEILNVTSLDGYIYLLSGYNTADE